MRIISCEIAKLAIAHTSPDAVALFQSHLNQPFHSQQQQFYLCILFLLLGRDVKEPRGFFIYHVFVGVFQYDSGTLKYALELKKTNNFFGFCPKKTEFLRSGTQGP